MAMKKAAKKSRRRLKRSVRRSLAAVLMITAIGIAAVPVPENYADNGDAASRAAAVVDKHDMSKFKYDADSADDVEPEKSIVLNKYANKDVADILNASDTAASYAITDIGGGDLSLSWQFLFYNVKNPIDSIDSGVICKYNSRFYSEKVDLTLMPITKYYTVESDDFENYYNGTSNKGMDNKATDAVIFNYDVYVSGDTSALSVKQFYEKYCKADYDSAVKEFQDYEAALNNYNNATDKDNLTKPTVPTTELSRIPSEVLTGEQRLQYYCEHNKIIKSIGTGYTLRSVVDSRPEPDGKGGMVYLVQVPADSIPVDPYTKDDAGFLVEERSKRLMCAIGDGAFKDVNNVVNMTIPDQIGFIGDEAFADASLLESITIGNTEHIGNRAFKGCVKLTTVNIRQGTGTIGKECFSGTAIQQIELPVSVTEIGYGAFANCKNLTNVNLNNIGRDCKIDAYAFYNCSALTEIAMENATIVSIGDGAFAVDTGSQPMNIVLPQGMTEPKSIGNYLFAGRSALESVKFPQNLGRSSNKATTIPDEVFHGCVNLKYIEFPCDPQKDPQAGGFISYNKTEKDVDGTIIKSGLFQDVINADFYVRGPKLNNESQPAYPRTSTWDATTTVSDTVPYLYVENGVEYYEVSDGFYLLCINNEGILISCTLKPGADVNKWLKEKEGKLEIPAMVGNTKVTGIASGCFSDSKLNENVRSLKIADESISSIADGVFQGGGGEHEKDWLNLSSVYIGNSVNSIGNNAFKNCSSLVDVTFNTPSAGYEGFTIGTDAFKTESGELTFHGDIVKGYAPFDWATDPGNIIQAQDKIRVCYKSLSPTYLTVMYNPITEMVTLLDYPKYSQVSEILNEKYGFDAGSKAYEDMKVAEWYRLYSGSDYDSYRKNFQDQWKSIQQITNEEEKRAQQEELYNSDSYGPWINEYFCANWNTWQSGGTGGDTISSSSSTQNPDENNPDGGGSGDDETAMSRLTGWLFDPVVVQAASTDLDAPLAYYIKNDYDIIDNVNSGDPYRFSEEERQLVNATKNIVVPEGVDSIDVYGYINNRTIDGETAKGENAGANTGNYNTYFNLNWPTETRNMYNGFKSDTSDLTDTVPGLFSGYYKDYKNSSDVEKYVRGNDLIESVTLSSVTYLPDYAFDSCENLQWVIIGDALADIGKAPFRGCYKMTSVSNNEYYTTENGIIYSNNTDGSRTIEECLSARGSGVGEGIVSLTSDPNLATVSAIKPGAFEDCDNITSISFGMNDTAGLSVIPEDCFRNCDRLSSIILPRTVNDVGKGAFVGANALNTLTFYGKEVKISGSAFENTPENKKCNTLVRTYEDSAVVRYVNEYGKEYDLTLDNNRLGELWTVTFLDSDHVMMGELVDKEGNEIENPQYVEDGAYAKVPTDPVHEGWTFEKWVGMNNAAIDEKITQDTIFYAQGYSNDGMINGKYMVEFYDAVDGKKIGPTQYISPGGEAIAPAPPTHDGYTFDKWSDTYTNIQTNKSIVALYKSAGGSGGSTNTSGGSTNTSGNSSGNRNPSNNATNTSSNRSTSSQTSSSTSTTSSSNASTSSSAEAKTTLYAVVVIGGSGSGSYAPGTPIVITANTGAAGSTFSKWTTDSPGVSLANVSQPTTTFTMPPNNVTITAEYTAGAAAATPAGSNAGGSGGSGQSSNTGNTRVDITKPGISNKDLATANVNGATDNFVIKISETDEATKAVADALTSEYGSLDNILYYAMDISLYDATGTTKITDTSGISVDITIPIPDALVAYGGNNMAGAVVNGNQLENLNESFTTINGVPCIRFTATHFSPYTVYVDTGNLTEGMLDTTPKTGDPIHPKWFLSIGLACLSIILFMKRDKRTKVKTA